MKKRFALCCILIMSVLTALLFLPEKPAAEPSLDNGLTLFHEGLLCVRDHETGKYGYIDRSGEYAIDPQFEDALHFEEDGTAQVRTGSEWKYISRKGKFIDKPPENTGSEATVKEEDAVWFSENDRWGLRDSSGNILYPPGFSSVQPFADNGLAAFCLAGQWGYIDRSGEIVIPNEFNAAFSFASNGMAAVSTGGKWGYIDCTGQYVIEPQFEEARSFSAGYAGIRADGKWGVINEKGQYLTEPSLDRWIADFGQDGLALVQKNGLFCFIDCKGKTVRSLPEDTEYIAEYGYDCGTLGLGKRAGGLFIFDRKGGILDLSGKTPQ